MADSETMPRGRGGRGRGRGRGRGGRGNRARGRGGRGGGPLGGAVEPVGEEFQIRAMQILETFKDNPKKDTYEFPPDLDNTQRKFIHNYCAKIGLHSKSHGKGDTRCLVISKKKHSDKGNVKNDGIPALELHPLSENCLAELKNTVLALNPTKLEKLWSVKTEANEEHHGLRTHRLKNRSSFSPTKPLSNTEDERERAPQYKQIMLTRQGLPVWSYRQELEKAIRNHRITIVSGDTGCGKSTQVSCRIDRKD